jgi:hypothetical protein
MHRRALLQRARTLARGQASDFELEISECRKFVRLSVFRQLREINVSVVKHVQGRLLRGSREIQCLYEAALYTH